MTQAFWKPRPAEPIAPEQGWIAKLLRWSLWISCAGWIVSSLFAYAFDDIKVIPDIVQSWMVIIGSGLVVTGAELNTAPMSVAVFTKVGAGNASKLDKRALAVSALGSMTSILIMFAIRQIRFGESWWRILALNWGPLIAGITVAADYYAASAELGLLKSDYKKELAAWMVQMEAWLSEEVAWNEAHGIEEPVDRTSWPLADLPAIRRIAAGLNGERAGVRVDNLQDYLDAERLRLPDIGETTRRRWAETLRSGG